ncbi:hypothetical protein vBKpMFBKp34_001 [Klebsiella phage vB_KpM_FBKp34]|nr:hypothetical protein vBKpMFBKp34_001 [Klebsiella phage vB_KpM_FBKp34]
MYFEVCYIDAGSSSRRGVGVYAATEEQAKQVAALLLQRAFGTTIDPSTLTVVETTLESDTPTTT